VSSVNFGTPTVVFKAASDPSGKQRVHRSSLLNHLVGGGQQRFRDGEAECLCGLHVDEEFDFVVDWSRRSAGILAEYR
jgi:hypothetical protein